MDTRITLPGPLGLGGAPLGNLFAPIPDDRARATIDAAWTAGIRFFDTAPLYGFGLSEHRMGEALRARPRDAFTLSTKVGRLLVPDPAASPDREGFVGGLPFRVTFDYGYDAARRSLEHSLHRLGLARLDVALIHDVGEDTHGPAWRERFDQAMAGAARALTDMRQEGLIRAWGLGVNRVEPCLLALEAADPDLFLIAGRYTLLDTTALAELFPRCLERGVRAIIGGPYNSGLLAGGDTFDYTAAPPALVVRTAALAAACARHGTDLRAAALQFCAAHPVVAATIPGARDPAELRANVDLMTAPIPPALWEDLRRVALIPDNAPTPAPSPSLPGRGPG